MTALSLHCSHMYLNIGLNFTSVYRPSPQEERGEGDVEDEDEPALSRKGSGMVKEFLRTPRHSVQTRGSASETPLSPVQSTTDILSEGKPQNGTGRTHSKVFQTRSSDWDIAQKTSVQNSHGKRTPSPWSRHAVACFRKPSKRRRPALLCRLSARPTQYRGSSSTLATPGSSSR